MIKHTVFIKVPMLHANCTGEDCLSAVVEAPEGTGNDDLHLLAIAQLKQKLDQSKLIFAREEKVMQKTVGGGKQSLAEIEAAKERGIPVYEKDLEAIA